MYGKCFYFVVVVVVDPDHKVSCSYQIHQMCFLTLVCVCIDVHKGKIQLCLFHTNKQKRTYLFSGFPGAGLKNDS